MLNVYIDSYQIYDSAQVINGIFIDEGINAGVDGLALSPVRLSTVDRGGEDGAYIGNHLYGGRLISIEGGIYAEETADFYAARRYLQNALSIERNVLGIPIAKTLKFTTRENVSYQVEVFVRSMNMLTRRFDFVPFKIDLYAPFPFLQSQEQKTLSLNATTNGGVLYPYVYPVVYGSNTSMGNAVNAGNARVFPVITLTGPLNDPVVINATTGAYMSIDHTFTASDVMVIDMQNKTITLNGTPAISKRSFASDWWYLQPGTNAIQITTSTSSDTGTASIVFRDTYLGI